MKKIAAVVAAVAAVGLSAPAVAAASPAPGCDAGTAVFTTGGMNDPTASAFPGTHRVTYSASIWPLGPMTYDESVRQGRDNLVAAVDEYAARGPGPIKIAGYSEGARVAGDALEVVQTRPYAGRVRGELFADPKHPGGIEDTFQGASAFGITMTGPRRGFTVPVESHCNPTDGICNLPNPVWNLIGFGENVIGYFTGAHMYPL